MIKKAFSYLLLLLWFVMPQAVYAQGDNISVYLNNSQLTFESQPKIINGSTFVPMRTIFEAMGYEIVWNDEDKTVIGVNDENVLSLTIGDSVANKNGIDFLLSAPPIIENGYTLVPLRFVAESADATVNWAGETKTVYIYTIEIPATERIGNAVVEEIVPTVSDEVEKVVEETTPKTVEELKKTVVQINTDNLQGSGVIVSENGYIVGNYHVMMGASQITVQFDDRSIYNGKVEIVAYDVANDIVIIKIDKTGLEYAELGNSDSVAVGDSVTTIGSPNGVLNTVSTGQVIGKTQHIIGSNALIDSGSSGGGLFNKKGQVVGITSSIDQYHTTYAIAINLVAKLELNQSIALSEWRNMGYQLGTPEGLSYYTEGGSAYISWGPVYPAKGYHVYSSTSIDGKYTIVKNPNNGGYIWGWGFPYCFRISATSKTVLYFKVVAVDEKNRESSLSETLEIYIP